MWSTIATCLFALSVSGPPPTLLQGGQGGVAGDPGDAEYTSKTHILTPGQTGEWEFDAKANDCVWATADSQAFDPAIEVLDPKGKVIASNDDIAPGQQEARILVRFPSEGKYKLLVKGFKGVAGGQYQITFRRFNAPLLAAGSELKGRRGQNDSLNSWVGVDLKKGEMIGVVQNGAFSRGLEVVGPTGDPIGGVLVSSAEGDNARIMARIDTDGVHYFRFGVRRDQDYKVVARAVTQYAGTPNGTVKLDGYTFAIATIPVRPATIYQLDLERKSGGAYMDFPASLNPVVGDQRLPRFLPVEQRAKRPQLARFDARTDTPVVMLLSTPVGQPSEFTVTQSEPAKPLATSASGQLMIGDNDFWRIDCRAGQVMRINVQASDFDSALVVRNMWGQELARINDKDGLNPGVTLAIAENGPIYAVVSCEGNGGQGSYTVSAAEAESMLITPNTTVAQPGAGSGEPQLWKVSGKRGQNILVNIRSNDCRVNAVVYGPDGRAVLSVENQPNQSTGARVLTLPADGMYTIWTYCDKEKLFTLQWLDIDPH